MPVWLRRPDVLSATRRVSARGPCRWGVSGKPCAARRRSFISLFVDSQPLIFSRAAVSSVLSAGRTAAARSRHSS